MIRLNLNLKLFSYDELNEKAKERAFDNHYIFLCETGEYNSVEYDYKFVEQSIKDNEYLFFYDGELANVTYYCGKHEKAGKTELSFQGEIYDITEEIKCQD